MITQSCGLKLLGNLASGEPVYDRFYSHLHGEVSELLPEIFATVSGTQNFMICEHDFGRIVGVTTCVATDEGDQVLYAQRPKRAGLTRFVMNRQAEPCSTAVIILKKDLYRPYYVLITAFIGRESGPEPWDIRATDENWAFWNCHALVYGSEEIIPGTETTICPW